MSLDQLYISAIHLINRNAIIDIQHPVSMLFLPVLGEISFTALFCHHGILCHHQHITVQLTKFTCIITP